MQYINVPDHDTYWANNEDMRRKTKEYEEWALAIVNDEESKPFSTTVRHPWMQHGFDINSKINVFQLLGDHGVECGPFDDVRDLLMHWENTPKDGSSETINRRVILVEDMHPRVIELLGVLLDIPPHFFLAHCDEFTELQVIDAAYAKQDSSTYWKVPVPRQRSIPKCVTPGQYLLEAGNFYRQEVEIRKGCSSVGLRSLVSCWSKSYAPKSWTTVLLLDPFETYMRRKDGKSAIRHKLGPMKFHRDIVYEVFQTGRKAENMELHQPVRRNTYSAALAAHNHHQESMDGTEDPFSGTVFVRNLIRSAWEESILREAVEINDMLISDREQYEQRQASAFSVNADSSDGSAQWTNASRAYQSLMSTRQSIQKIQAIVDSIMWKFRCKGNIALNESQDSVFVQEKQSWMMISDTLSKLESTVANHMEMWSQRAALEQAAAAHRSARTSGQLTKIATIIVPCTFVASIFSMGGNFAAGEDLFFVYWTISIPVTVALLGWILHHDIRKMYRQWKPPSNSYKICFWGSKKQNRDTEKGSKDQHA